MIAFSNSIDAQLKNKEAIKTYSEAELYAVATKLELEDDIFRNKKLLPEYQQYLKKDKGMLYDYLSTSVYEQFKFQDDIIEFCRDVKQAASLSEVLKIFETPGKYVFFKKMNKTFAKNLKEQIVDKKNTWMFVVANKDKHSKYMDFGTMNNIDFISYELNSQIINQKEVFAKQPKWQAAYQEYRKTQVADK
jgi:hypothetical protein